MVRALLKRLARRYINAWSLLVYWGSVALLLLATWFHSLPWMGVAAVGVLISKIWPAKRREDETFVDALLGGQWFRFPRSVRDVAVVLAGWTLVITLVILLWKEILTIALLLLVALVAIRILWRRFRPFRRRKASRGTEKIST